MSDEIKGTTVNSAPEMQGEPHEWEKCTVRLSITFFPDDGNESGRQVALGCNTHNDPPLIEFVRAPELGSLPPLIAELLDRLKQRLPEQAALAETRRQAEYAAEEKARLARLKNEERIKAAGRRYQEKNGKPQKAAPAVVEKEIRESGAAENIESSTLENVFTAMPANGEQQSLFG
ncbi:MAG: hypothetical protein AB7P14_17925 [Blastocatellales bacterium]